MIDVRLVDAFGRSNNANADKCNPNKMVVMRMQVKDIMSQVVPNQNLGSVVFAQSSLMVDESQTFITVTEGVPNIQAWFTNINHHESLPLEVNTQKNL